MRIPTLSTAARALSFSSMIQQRLGGRVPSPLLSTEGLVELPGGTPFSLCPVSRPTDLFDIRYVNLTRTPFYIDDFTFVQMFGFLRSAGTWTANAIVNTIIDCGSHCEMYGNPPGERPSTSFSLPFCEFSYIQNEAGGSLENATCVPEKGRTLISSPIMVLPMFLSAPGWYNFTFDAKTAEGQRIYCLTTEVCLRWEDPEKNKHYPEGPWSNCSWPR